MGATQAPVNKEAWVSFIIPRLMDPVFIFRFQPDPSCKEVRKTPSWSGASIFHRGDPLWAFTNDYTDVNAWPTRFQLHHQQHSRKNTSVYDVDALYFERGLIVFVNEHFSHRLEGSGVLKIPDFYYLQSIYREGILGVFYQTDFFSCLTGQPYVIRDYDEMKSIWTLQRCVLF